jgi:hypothetical protein
VQVTAEPTALLLPGGDQPGPRRVERVPQGYHVRGGGHLPGQVGQQPLVVLAQPLPVRALADEQPANRLPLEGQRESDELSRDFAAGRAVHPAVRDPEQHGDVR